MSEFVATKCASEASNTFQVVEFKSYKRKKVEPAEIERCESNDTSEPSVLYLRQLYNEIRQFGTSDHKSNKSEDQNKAYSRFVKKRPVNYKKFQEKLREEKRTFDETNDPLITGKNARGRSTVNTKTFYKKLNKRKKNVKILKYYGKIDPKSKK